MRYAKSLRVLLSGLCALALAGNYLLQPALATGSSAASGQLSLARQVLVNGNSAIAGQTVFSGSRIQVAKQGTAVLNLGKLGRIELGADSDFALRMVGDVIGGELNSGCVTISAPASVNIELNTTKGHITSDGKAPSSLLVGVKNDAASILPTLGTVKVTMGGSSEKASAGEFLKLISDSKNGERLVRRPAAECSAADSMCSCSPIPTSTAGKSAAPGTNSILLPVLILTAAGGTAAVIAGLLDGGYHGLTCIGGLCRPVSPTVP
jgi:hypothetical protein